VSVESKRTTARRLKSITLFLIANYSILTGTWGQNTSQSSPQGLIQAAAACPSPAQVTPLHLYGLWRAEFDGQPGATLLFEKHAELAGSVSGAVNRDGIRTLCAGDVDDDGTFTLEESDNGQTISATWSGTVIDNSCGKEIRGTWIKSISTTPANAVPGQASNYRFVLRKLPGWQ
jgi:hypothetical protein